MMFHPAFGKGPGFGLSLLFVSITSTQIGSSFAKMLFAHAGTEATVALRLIFATLILFAGLRPWRHIPEGRAWKHIALYGVSIAVMNACFYQAISRIPIGIAVAIEFSGPLLVATFSSRRLADFAGVAFAVAGLMLLMPWNGVDGALDPWGIMYAALAAIFWGTYIIVGRKAGEGAGSSAAAWGSLIGAMVAVPWSLCMTGGLLFPLDKAADVLPLAFLVGLMASALPYALEMVALRIVPPQAFGVLMSLEPAVAALLGFLILGEVLSFSQWSAIVLVILASLIVTANARQGRSTEEQGS